MILQNVLYSLSAAGESEIPDQHRIQPLPRGGGQASQQGDIRGRPIRVFSSRKKPGDVQRNGPVHRRHPVRQRTHLALRIVPVGDDQRRQLHMVLDQVEAHPKLATSFERLTFLPLAGMTEMIPPGGAGAGMHVIPVEKAIPATSQSVSVEHLSHWLKKYEGQIGVGYCSCRNAARLAGKGCGELQDELCISVGTLARYCEETGKGHSITYDEAMI